MTSLTRNFTLEQAPSVLLGDPPNNTFQNTSNVIFYYDISDSNNNLANSTLIINGQVNITNQSALINEATNNFSIDLSDGAYNWTVNVTDLTNLISTGSPFRVLTVDTKEPSIILNYPPNATALSTNNVSLNYTAFDNIDVNLTCNLSVDEALAFTNIPSLNGTDIANYLIKSDGTYTWNVNCMDDAQNNNYSETRTFSVEAPPNVTLLSPINSIQSNSSNITFIYLPEDPIGFGNCTLYIDNVFNTSDNVIESNQNNSFAVVNILEGRHNWTVQCFDAFPDFNGFTAQIRNFTIDTSAPSVNLNSPLNNTNTLKTAIFNFSASDNLDLDNILSCNLYVDNSLNQSNFNVTNGSSTTRSISGHSLGTHTWNATCIDDAANRGWSQIWSYNVTLADLMVNYSSIAFNNTSPSENESVSINATIYNIENVTITNITVQFFDGDPEVDGVQIGSNQVISTINSLGNVVLNVTWLADLGASNIFVVVDSNVTINGSIEEWNETNNKANSSITIGAWQFVYGDITSQSQFELANPINNSVIRWPATNFEEGNIYVVDSESLVSWSDLQAIGKNISDGNATNDFSNIDSLLNMTNFADSVANTYTNSSGSILNRTNLFVFNRFIDEVPIANSTNNTNFVTGILWDVSDNNDSNNGEYDITDKEDIVFLTSINKDKVGAYGIYDYEIRIPAKLREYKTADLGSVVFYSEVS